MRKRVLLADDHTVVRDGLKAIMEQLDPDIVVVNEASNGREVLEMAEQTPADVYLLDISMPVLNGIEATIRLLKNDPSVKVIILSMYKDKVLVEKAISSGARGYILKESATEEIVKAIDEVYAGRYYFSPEVSGYLVQGFLHGQSEEAQPPESNLTDRQREILKLICDGYTEKDIGEELNISYHTVHVHKNNIMKALDIHSKAELIKYAVKNQIIQL
ncbi:MAG: response regulator transcription factor [Spirochaetota bacterium]